jgi:DNA primase
MVSKIPQDFIDQLLDKSDLVDLISSRISVKKRGKNYLACCPFHDEKTPSFNINPVKQFYYCFGCSAGGNAINFLMEYDKLTFMESVEDLAENLGMSLPEVAYSQDAIQNSFSSSSPNSSGPNLSGPSSSGFLGKDLDQNINNIQIQFALLDKIAGFYSWSLRQEDGKVCVDYLKNRGISGDLAKRYQLGWIGDTWDNLIKNFVGKTLSVKSSKNNKSNKYAQNNKNAELIITQDMLIQAGLLIKNEQNKVYDRFRARLMFPIRDRRGRVLGFGGRVVTGDGKPKYLNSPETALFLKSQVLYGLYEVLQHKRDIARVCVVEGYMDVIGLAQYGIDYSVATLGTSTSEDHIKQLIKVTGEIIFCFDGDRAGKTAAWRALLACLPVMSGKFKVNFLFLPDGEDPDSIVKSEGKAGFIARLDKSIPLSEVLFNYLSCDVDLNFADGRALLLDKLLPLLLQVPDGSYKVLLCDMAAQKTQLSIDQIEKQLILLRGSSSKIKKEQKEEPKYVFSYLDRAISLLLFEPKLALETDLSLIDRAGDLKGLGRVLVKLIIWLKDQLDCKNDTNKQYSINSVDNISLDKILMQFSNKKIKKRLAELAMIDHSLGHEALRSEFLDLIERFKREYQLSFIDSLIVKSKKISLSDDEKDILKGLLVKHKLKLN